MERQAIMNYLLLSLMLANLICAFVAIFARFSSIAGDNKGAFFTYKLFGGISYALLGFLGLVVKGFLVGAQSFYLPLISVAFIALGVWMISSGLKARRAQ